MILHRTGWLLQIVSSEEMPRALLSDKKALGQSLGRQGKEPTVELNKIDISLAFMDKAGIDLAILSFPGFPSNDVGTEMASLRNKEMADICASHPTRFAFFATLPHLSNTQGCLQEISHVFDTLHAQGVALPSLCGTGPDAKYIADEAYEPIWAELNKRRAVVHLHGTQTPSSTPYPGPFLGIPISEVPNETFKAAAHLVVSGFKRKYPDVKIVLAHLGGSMPYLAARVATLSPYMGCPLTPEEIIEDFKTFYYDTALSASDANLKAVEAFASLDRVVYGSDFPAVTSEIIQWYDNHLVAFTEERGEKDNDTLRAICAGNIGRLL
ncbi:hypothetical protein BD626DRAFT_546260 [Schizophyllum amplum]|uniref:6-methylsalicylate decarboxylase n=1 Tax=Schizophyllum amplum TaxID=97359 RepID=A0A550CLZ1_9AGAR|nr:hypothetical protein BD626DRAFT_546260 [Auriculariopsis ampla]